MAKYELLTKTILTDNTLSEYPKELAKYTQQIADEQLTAWDESSAILRVNDTQNYSATGNPDNAERAKRNMHSHPWHKMTYEQPELMSDRLLIVYYDNQEGHDNLSFCHMTTDADGNPLLCGYDREGFDVTYYENHWPFIYWRTIELPDTEQIK